MSLTDERSRRERLIDACVALFHERGFGSTTIAQIAERAEVPQGGVYYHFPSKQDMIEAAAEAHARQVQGMLDGLDAAHASPRARVATFLHLTASWADERARLGCPAAALVCDASREDRALVAAASAALRLSTAWIASQASACGLSEARAGALARHVTCVVQGSYVLGHALSDPGVIHDEIARLRAWVDEELGGAGEDAQEVAR